MLPTISLFANNLWMPLAQVSDNWLRSWLQPIWFLGVGVGIGLIALAIAILLFRLLSVTPWSGLAKTVQGHVVSAILTAVMAGGLIYYLNDRLGDNNYQERLLTSIAITLMCGIFGWALVFCAGKQAARTSLETLTEGAAGYIGIAALSLVFLAAILWAVGSRLANPIVENPIAVLQSIPAVFSAGLQDPIVTKLAPKPQDADAPFVEVQMPADFSVVGIFKLKSETTVVLADADDVNKFVRPPLRLAAGESVDWSVFQPITDLPLATGPNAKVYAQNQEITENTITINYVTQPPVPEAGSLTWIAFGTFVFGLAILLQNAAAPRVSAVALATIKNELGQPLFLVLMMLGSVLILLFTFLSFNTFGEDIKLLKDCGITVIMLLAAFQGVWSASSSVSDEIEGRTALTVLSKPIQRRSFVIGKFMGLFWILALMFVVLGAFELLAVAYKPLYDAREASLDMPGWQQCHFEVMKTIPGLLMGFMQAVLLTAVSVALATRLPLLANLSICFAIYLVGNLSTSIVSSTQGTFTIVEFIAQLVATIIPILEHFQMQSAIDADKTIPISLLSGNLVYCLLYVMMAMFIALILFEDRDLA
jgi:ABC-type transport system involved in multi-copper enzyme maturation permease subunit